jgi:hypothetical protein
MSNRSSLPRTAIKRIGRGLVRTPPPKIAKDDALPVSATGRRDQEGDAGSAARTCQPHGFSVGNRVLFEADGFRGAGVIDDVTHDGSVVWVWPDDAMGRKMLCLDDVTVITCEEPAL